MCAEIINKSKIDSNFIETIDILEKNKISYWLCHGTLLGIIRDNELIPWDKDIDFAVWYSENLKNKIKNIMIDNKYELKSKYIDDGSLTFKKNNSREVDINFYKIKKINSLGETAYVKFFVPKNNFCKLIDALSLAKNYKGKYKFFINKLNIFSNYFEKFKLFLIKKNLFYKNLAYTVPFILFKNFKKIKYKNIFITVPLESEKYLSFVFGKHWRVPKKNYNWIVDSPSSKTV